MIESLQRAFDEASKLSPPEQAELASRLLAELTAEDEPDLKAAGPGNPLARLAREALDESHAGLTEELDPDRM